MPQWFLVYRAAGENPLEAQRMMDELTGEWWHNHLAAQKAKAKAAKQMG